MTTQQQEQQPEQLDTRGRQRRRISGRSLVIIIVLILAIVISVIWILSYLHVIPSFLASIFTIIITVLGAVFTFFQSMHLFIPADKHDSDEKPPQAHASLSMPYTPAPSPPMPPIIVQVPATQPYPSPSPLPVKASYRGIVGSPPLTDPRTIQQRKQVVKAVYEKLTQPDITAIALTGIGGVGKSTLAALIYRYAEQQRQTRNSPFFAETLWLTIDPAVTFADLIGNLFEVLGKPPPDLGNLAPQNQAAALFNALNNTDKPYLIILDQFENLLDWNSGHVLTDRPGVGEWLDIINSQPCTCRILLTSRPHPMGTRVYPPTYLQEYPVGGLEVGEGVALLRNRGVQGTDSELQFAVTKCAGHAFSLTLLASLVLMHNLNLGMLLQNSALWIGDIATNILDQIFMLRLNKDQREILLAFSVYREPVLVDAALAIMAKPLSTQIQPALKALVTQHLLEAIGGGKYQLHAIIADYARIRFEESNEQSKEGALQAAHEKAAQFYLEQSAKNCPSRARRQRISDVRDLIEAAWQYFQAEQWRQAYDLLEQEGIFTDLRR